TARGPNEPGGSGSCSLAPSTPGSLRAIGAVWHPRTMPAAVGGDEVVGRRRAPGAGYVGVQPGRVVEQRLHDAPGLFDVVLAREVAAVAPQRGLEQDLLRRRTDAP